MNARVARWLGAHPEWAGAEVEELGGGRSNRAWRLSTPRRQGVLKLDAGGRDWPGNSRAEEAHVQQAAAEAGLAAPVLWHSAEGILTGWLDGASLDRAALRDESVLRKIGVRLRELHALEATERHFDFARWSAHYRDLLTASGHFDRSASDACALLERVSLPGPRVLSHNDLVPANILAGDRLRFLDWEYAATNSWLFDLATLCVEGALSADDTAVLFDAYAKGTDAPPALADAVMVYRQLVMLWEKSRLPAVS